VDISPVRICVEKVATIRKALKTGKPIDCDVILPPKY
jgi:hypothetical protein